MIYKLQYLELYIFRKKIYRNLVSLTKALHFSCDILLKNVIQSFILNIPAHFNFYFECIQIFYSKLTAFSKISDKMVLLDGKYNCCSFVQS